MAQGLAARVAIGRLHVCRVQRSKPARLAAGCELAQLVAHVAEGELAEQGGPDRGTRLDSLDARVAHRDVELAPDAVGRLVGAPAVQHLLVVQRHVALLEQAELDGARSYVLLVHDVGAQPHRVSSHLEVAAVEGGVLRLRVSAGQVDGRTHLCVHVLQRDKGGVQRRGGAVGGVWVERLLLRARLGDEARELVEGGLPPDYLLEQRPECGRLAEQLLHCVEWRSLQGQQQVAPVREQHQVCEPVGRGPTSRLDLLLAPQPLRVDKVAQRVRRRGGEGAVDPDDARALQLFGEHRAALRQLRLAGALPRPLSALLLGRRLARRSRAASKAGATALPSALLLLCDECGSRLQQRALALGAAGDGLVLLASEERLCRRVHHHAGRRGAAQKQRRQRCRISRQSAGQRQEASDRD
mmetsp:Transcript_50181/g.167675  ORF Transcript_50181/g.167675 Transcript_50181/m.167675 type:complete len:412 (+) Transcript_50181:176-1411(+)